MSRGNNPVETATEKVIADARLSFGRPLEEVRDQGFLLAIIPRVDEKPGTIVGRHRHPGHQSLLGRHRSRRVQVTMMMSLLEGEDRGTVKSWCPRSFLSIG